MSPAPDFCAVKYACATAAKEEKDTASIDLLSFFLQTEANEDDEKIIIKFAGAVALLLVEVDERWRKHSHKENGKWIIYGRCSKITHGTINAALMAYRNLARHLKQ